MPEAEHTYRLDLLRPDQTVTAYPGLTYAEARTLYDVISRSPGCAVGIVGER